MTTWRAILSTIDDAPTSNFVYSSLSYFGKPHGGALPGTWFVRALGDLGREPAAVRQTLFRMVKDGELETRREGRVKWYAPSAFAIAEIDAGTKKIFEPADAPWDGEWTMLHLLPEADPRTRARVTSLLRVRGFAELGGGGWLHPRPLEEDSRASLPAAARSALFVVRGPLAGARDLAPAVARLWKLPELARRYDLVTRRLQAVKARLDTDGATDLEAFRLRFAVVIDYLRVAWDDPELPARLLPRDWSGTRARRLAAELYRRLLPAALRHSESLLEPRRRRAA